MLELEIKVFFVMSIWTFECYVKEHLNKDIDVLEELGGAKDITIGKLVGHEIPQGLAFEFNITQDKINDLDEYYSNTTYDSKTEYYLYALCSKGLLNPGKYLLNTII